MNPAVATFLPDDQDDLHKSGISAAPNNGRIIQHDISRKYFYLRIPEIIKECCGKPDSQCKCTEGTLINKRKTIKNVVSREHDDLRQSEIIKECCGKPESQCTCIEGTSIDNC
jgi:hypothetical protein